MLRAGGESGLDAGKRIEDALDDGEGGGGAGFEDDEEDGALAVLADDVGLGGGAVGYGGDVAEVDDGAAGGAEGDVGDAFDGGGGGVDEDVVLYGADFSGAAGLDDVLGGEGGKNVGW